MIIDRVQHAGWRSNTWLIAGRVDGPGLLVDPGGDPPRALEMVRRRGVKIEAIVCTHRHYVHAQGSDFLARNLQAPVLTHPLEKPFLPEASGVIEEGHRFDFGEWAAEVIHLPGHTTGMIGLAVPGVGVFVSDLIFRGSVGSTIHPGSAGFEALKKSALERVLSLPPETVIYPGHGDTTTVRQELERNPFVRLWTGVDVPGTRPARFDGKRVTIEVWARDFDGTNKAQVRYADGRADIVAAGKLQKVTL